MKTFILIRGVPGSGKSTVAKALVASWEAAGKSVAGPFESDHYMVDNAGRYAFNPKKLGYCHKMCLLVTTMAFERGVEIVVQSNTNVKRWEFQKYLDAAKLHGYKVQEIIVDGDFGNTHGVPAEKVQEMRDRFEF
jgi:uridine kinase